MSSDEELGACLRDARTAKEMKIADLAQETGLPERYLEALEAGRFGELPDKAYARIYFANYARVLGLDTESLMLQWPDPTGLVAPPTESHRRRMPWWGLPAVALLLVVAWAVTVVLRSDREPAVDDSTPRSAGAPPDAIPVARHPAGDSVLTAAVSDTVANAVVDESAAEPVSAVVEVHELVVHATNQTWVKIKADGEVLRDTVLRPGDSLTAAGRGEFLLWATNPEWVRVRLDGKGVDLPQDEGEALIGHEIPLTDGGQR
jgi:cytoskeletal protein RodZ